MRMNQDERRFDFHGLGAALKRAREEKGWTQAYVAELVDRDSRTIMNIENKGQYPSFDLFVKLITMFDVSVDQFIHADGGARSSSCRKHIVQHITGTVKRKAQAAFPVIVGAHPRDQRTDFLLLVTGQLPGVHLRLRATMARRAGLHDQRPELLPALFFLSFALLVVTASLTRVVIVPAGVRYFLHHSFKRAACKIHSHSSVSFSHGGVSSSSGSSAISSSSPSSYSQ